MQCHPVQETRELLTECRFYSSLLLSDELLSTVPFCGDVLCRESFVIIATYSVDISARNSSMSWFFCLTSSADLSLPGPSLSFPPT